MGFLLGERGCLWFLLYCNLRVTLAIGGWLPAYPFAELILTYIVLESGFAQNFDLEKAEPMVTGGSQRFYWLQAEAAK